MMIVRHRGPTKRPTRGQSLVEFALIFPILILLLVAIFDLGRAVFAYNSITNAAREGARLAIVDQDVTRIKTRATNQASMADKNLSDVTVTFLEQASTGSASAITCAPLQIGCVARVQYSTVFRPATPVLSAWLFPSGVTLTATSVEAIEFVCPNAAVTAAACPKQP